MRPTYNVDIDVVIVIVGVIFYCQIERFTDNITIIICNVYKGRFAF